MLHRATQAITAHEARITAAIIVLLALATLRSLLRLTWLPPMAEHQDILVRSLALSVSLGTLIAFSIIAAVRRLQLRKRALEHTEPSEVDDFEPAVTELRKLARRQDDAAREPLLAIAKHLAALSRASLPIRETRTERHLARSLAEAAAGLRHRGADLEPDALQPLMEIAAELEAAHAASRDRRSRDFTLTTQALQQQVSSRSRSTSKEIYKAKSL